jgi:hypothetical protein
MAGSTRPWWPDASTVHARPLPSNDHEHYVEPYAGSLAVLLAKPRSRMETVNDLDGDLMTFWRVLRDQPEDLTRVCALTPHARAEQLEAYASAKHPTTSSGPAASGCRSPKAAPESCAEHRLAALRRPGRVGHVDARIPRGLRRPDRPRRRSAAGVSLECQPALELITRYGERRRAAVRRPALPRLAPAAPGEQLPARDATEHRAPRPRRRPARLQRHRRAVRLRLAALRSRPTTAGTATRSPR